MSSTNTYICKICSKSYISKKSLASHTNWHDPEYIKKGSLGAKNGLPKATQAKFQKNKDTLLINIKEYLIQPNICIQCDSDISYPKRNNKFCSRTCSAKYNNLHRTNDTKIKQSRTLKATLEQHRLTNPKVVKYNKCVICRSDHTLKGKTCSPDCKGKYISAQVKGKTGGWRNFGGNSKKGYCHNIFFQSSYEEVFILYHTKHNIPFRRCTEYFEYIYENRARKYYPDFFLPNTNTYVEVKGFQSNLTDIKFNSIPSEFNKIMLTSVDIIQMKLTL